MTLCDGDYEEFLAGGNGKLKVIFLLGGLKFPKRAFIETWDGLGAHLQKIRAELNSVMQSIMPLHQATGMCVSQNTPGSSS